MIYVLIGPTCSGKTTILKELVKNDYKNVVSYTTRPMRPGEVDGKDYHFISEDQYNFMLINKMIIAPFVVENAFGTVWKYGVNIEDLQTNEDIFIILEPSGYRNLITRLGKERVIGIYLDISQTERYARGIKRTDVMQELIRRLLQDERDFKDFDKEVDCIIRSTNKEEVLYYISLIVDASK